MKFQKIEMKALIVKSLHSLASNCSRKELFILIFSKCSLSVVESQNDPGDRFYYLYSRYPSQKQLERARLLFYCLEFHKLFKISAFC